MSYATKMTIRPVKLFILVAFAPVLLSLLASQPAVTAQKQTGLSFAECVCTGGTGSCSSKTGPDWKSCGKNDGDTCTGTCDFEKTGSGGNAGPIATKGVRASPRGTLRAR
jgi:hypothetical protein